MARNEKAIAEFENSLITVGGSRPVMSRPPMPKANTKLVEEVRLLLADGPTAEDVADWYAAKAERYAMYHARPVFEMDGTGPACSHCSGIWPLCGCHHYASGLDDDNEEKCDD